MSNRKWKAARRAWNTLRRWKIQSHRRRPFAVELRLVRRLIKRLAHPASMSMSMSSTSSSSGLRPHYAERQFSFDDTPIFHRRPAAASRFHLPRIIPCINPKVEFDYAFESCEEEGDDHEIDLRAEKFINMFYQQMKLQNQISYLQYNEFSDDQ